MISLIIKKASSRKGKSFSIALVCFYFFPKKSFTLSVGTILSLNIYAPDLGDFTILTILAKSFPDDCNDATTFLAMVYTI